MSRLRSIRFWAVCSIVILTILAYGTVHQPIITVFYGFTGALAFVWIVEAFRNDEIDISRTTLQIPLILLTLYAFLQTIPVGAGTLSGTLSIDPFSTQLTGYQLSFLSIFFVVSLTAIETTARLRQIVTILVSFGFLYSFYAILQSVLSPEKIFGIYHPQSGRPFGSFVNRHDYAAIIEMVVFLPLGLLFGGAVSSEKRLLYVITVGLMLTSLLLSGSRGGLVAFVGGLLLLIILSSKAKGIKQRVILAGLGSMLLLVAVGGSIFVGGDTSLTRFGEAATENVTSNRSEIWAVTLRVIKEYLPIGAGLGAFGQAYPQFDPGSGILRVEQAHNDYLQILADAGIVGGFLGAAFLWALFVEGRRTLKTPDTYRRAVAMGALASVFAVLVHSMFDFVLHITAVSVMFLTILSILTATGREYAEPTGSMLPGKRKGADIRAINSAV